MPRSMNQDAVDVGIGAPNATMPVCRKGCYGPFSAHSGTGELLGGDRGLFEVAGGGGQTGVDLVGTGAEHAGMAFDGYDAVGDLLERVAYVRQQLREAYEEVGDRGHEHEDLGDGQGDA